MKTKLEYAVINYKAVEDILKCPVCSCSMVINGTSLECENHHTIDINRKGIASFSKALNDDLYDNDLFKARRKVMDSGLYDEVFGAINEVIESLDIATLLDAGVGEGSYLNRISEVFKSMRTIGVDLARDGLNIASSDVNSVWMLADIASLPIKDESIDLILNILSPANYAEFNRVLSKDGYLLKVIVNQDYLREMRDALGLSDHKNLDVMSILQDRMNIISIQDIKYTKAVDESLTYELLKMTPLAKNYIGDIGFYQITVDLKLVLCKVK